MFLIFLKTDICPPGQVSRGGDTICFSCPIGWAVYNSTEDNRAQCLECLAGSRSVDMKCTKCKSGFHQPENGTGFCLPCIPGEFNTKDGMKTCSKCAIGTYSPSKERTEACEECPKGFITRQTGSPRCVRFYYTSNCFHSLIISFTLTLVYTFVLLFFLFYFHVLHLTFSFLCSFFFLPLI